MMALKGFFNTIYGGNFCQGNVSITFSDQDLEMIKLPHANPLVIKLRIGDAMMSKVLVDGGNISDILF